MRIDHDNLRSDSTFWRRIIVLMVVITAVPVILWGTTAFVRSYVARPKVPTFRTISSALVETSKSTVAEALANRQAETAGQQGGNTNQSNASEPRPVTPAEPSLQTAEAIAADAKASLPGDPAAAQKGNANAMANSAKPAVVASAVVTAGDPLTVGSTKEQARLTPAYQPPTAYAVTAPAAVESTPSTNATAEALPAAAPLPDPVPLPRARPRNLAVSQLGPAVPRVRPHPQQPEAIVHEPAAIADGPPDLFGVH